MLRRTFSTHFETGAHFFFSLALPSCSRARVGRFNKRFLLVVPSRRKTGREEKHEAERERKERERCASRTGLAREGAAHEALRASVATDRLGIAGAREDQADGGKEDLALGLEGDHPNVA